MTKVKKQSLTLREQTFCHQYLCIGNATEAYIRAGYTASTRATAGTEGMKLLKKPKICTELSRLAKIAEEKATDDVAEILNMWTGAMSYDPREISEMRRGACRWCHGIKYAYQWRIPDEFNRKMEAWNALSEAKQLIQTPPNDEGGYGYSRNLVPHPDCPMCDGDGHEYAYFHDSRGYSKSAAIAFNGVQVTQNGLKINTIDRVKASENLAKFHGMFLAKDTGEVVDTLGALIASIQKRGSKAPLNGMGDAPVAKSSASVGAVGRDHRHQ